MKKILCVIVSLNCSHLAQHWAVIITCDVLEESWLGQCEPQELHTSPVPTLQPQVTLPGQCFPLSSAAASLHQKMCVSPRVQGKQPGLQKQVQNGEIAWQLFTAGVLLSVQNNKSERYGAKSTLLSINCYIIALEVIWPFIFNLICIDGQLEVGGCKWNAISCKSPSSVLPGLTESSCYLLHFSSTRSEILAMLNYTYNH